MKFKWCTLLAFFIFVLSGCGGSDSPSITTPVDSDGDGVSDDLDDYIYDPEKSVLDVITTLNFRAPIRHVLLPNVVILDVVETTKVETFNNEDVKTTSTTTYTSLDSIIFGETTVADWSHSDGTFSRIYKGSYDFNLDGQAQFISKSLDLGTRNKGGEIYWNYIDEDDAAAEGGNNGNFGRVFDDVDFTARTHPEDLSEIDVVSLVTRTWVKEDSKNIITTDFHEYDPDGFDLIGYEALNQIYAQNTIEEIVAGKVVAVSDKRDWSADGTINESNQFTSSGEKAYIYSSQRPIWADPNDAIDAEYADFNYVSNKVTNYWMETTETFTEGHLKSVGKRFVLDMADFVKLVNLENPNGLLFQEWDSIHTSIHEAESNEYSTWTHYALEGYDFTSSVDDPGQVYRVLQKQGNGIWVGYGFNEWGSQSVTELAEKVENLRAGGTELLNIDETMIPGLSTYARIIPTHSFRYDENRQARTWYLVSNNEDFAEDGLHSMNTVTITDNGLKEGWLVYDGSGVIALAKSSADGPDIYE
ncbi:MAG: hypothetical protein V7782_15465, partial [Psychromonas sp.]